MEIRITKEMIKKTEAPFKPKAIVCMVDELSEIMNSSNFKLVNSIQTNLGSIARLGRAAACHLVLATQRPSANVINADMKNNIQMSVLLGDFDASASTLLMDEDISNRSKPDIKGRGFLKSGKEIVEFQSFWTEKEKHFVKKDVEAVDAGLMGCEYHNGMNNESGQTGDSEQCEQTEQNFGFNDYNAEQNIKDRELMMSELSSMRKKASAVDVGEVKKEKVLHKESDPLFASALDIFSDEKQEKYIKDPINKDKTVEKKCGGLKINMHNNSVAEKPLTTLNIKNQEAVQGAYEKRCGGGLPHEKQIMIKKEMIKHGD